MEDSRLQAYLKHEYYALFTGDSWESILSLPDEARFENMAAYIACQSFLLTADTSRNFDNEELWKYLREHGAGYIVDGFFAPDELHSLESLLESIFSMVGWTDGGIYFKMEADHPTRGIQQIIVFDTWAKFHEYVMNCFVEDNDDISSVMDFKFICEKIRHFLSLNPSLPQIKEEAAEKAA